VINYPSLGADGVEERVVFTINTNEVKKTRGKELEGSKP
jgi:hypothetical protein